MLACRCAFSMQTVALKQTAEYFSSKMERQRIAFQTYGLMVNPWPVPETEEKMPWDGLGRSCCEG